MGKKKKKKRKQSHRYAEETCWALLVAISLGGLDEVDPEWRQHIADPLEKWATLNGKDSDDELQFIPPTEEK